MGQTQGHSEGQSGVNGRVKPGHGTQKPGSAGSKTHGADPGGPEALRLSSLAWSPPLMKRAEPIDDPPPPGSADHTRAALSHLMAALQQLQTAAAQDGEPDRDLVHDAALRVQRLLAMLAQQEEPRAASPPMDQQRVRAFAVEVRKRRRAAGLNQAQLAERAGLCLSTIKTIERGDGSPCRATLCRLLSVPDLGLQVAAVSPDVQSDPAWSPNTWMPPSYDPVRMSQAMVQLLNGPGGTFDQSYLYLDPQSASDWLQLCNSELYAQTFRDGCPLDQIAARAAKVVGGGTLDINALGPGDGRQEVRLVQNLLREMPRASARLLLLDISHTLLATAWQYASATLEPSRVAAFALHGNFHDLARYPILHEAPGRVRIYTLLGYTLANLANEVLFFRELARCAAAGDLLVLDFTTAYGSPDQPAAVREREPVLVKGAPPSHVDWLTGPVLRHCRGAQSVHMSVELLPHCLVPGSYELGFTARVAMADRTERRFMVGRLKRYEPQGLAQCLRGLGWEPVLTKLYGPAGANTAAVMLLQRAQ